MPINFSSNTLTAFNTLHLLYIVSFKIYIGYNSIIMIIKQLVPIHHHCI